MVKNYRFFLGGNDLEMAEIRALIQRHAPGRLTDKQLSWGAALSAYQDELLTALQREETPVAIELKDDLPADLFDRGRIVVVDHHGERAGAERPSSIEQIFELLALPKSLWSRRLTLVSANDKAHVAGLIEAGATVEEILAIRADDRAAQGVTPDDEAEAVRAIAHLKHDGRLTIIQTSSRTSSAIADLMVREVGGPGYERLLVIMPSSVAVFGDGEAISDLGQRYAGSWWGGNLPKAGFWGMARAQGEGLDRLIEALR